MFAAWRTAPPRERAAPEASLFTPTPHTRKSTFALPETLRPGLALSLSARHAQAPRQHAGDCARLDHVRIAVERAHEIERRFVANFHFDERWVAGALARLRRVEDVDLRIGMPFSAAFSSAALRNVVTLPRRSSCAAASAAASGGLLLATFEVERLAVVEYQSERCQQDRQNDCGEDDDRAFLAITLTHFFLLHTARLRVCEVCRPIVLETSASRALTRSLPGSKPMQLVRS
jgi:hypothetical protein